MTIKLFNRFVISLYERNSSHVNILDPKPLSQAALYVSAFSNVMFCLQEIKFQERYKSETHYLLGPKIPELPLTVTPKASLDSARQGCNLRKKISIDYVAPQV